MTAVDRATRVFERPEHLGEGLLRRARLG
jgi:hypothetical protein